MDYLYLWILNTNLDHPESSIFRFKHFQLQILKQKIMFRQSKNNSVWETSKDNSFSFNISVSRISNAFKSFKFSKYSSFFVRSSVSIEELFTIDILLTTYHVKWIALQVILLHYQLNHMKAFKICVIRYKREMSINACINCNRSD